MQHCCVYCNAVAVKQSHLPVVGKTSTPSHRQSQRAGVTANSRSTSSATSSRTANAPSGTARNTASEDRRDTGKHHASMLDKLKLLGGKNKTSSTASSADVTKKLPVSQLPQSSSVRPSQSAASSGGVSSSDGRCSDRAASRPSARPVRHATDAGGRTSKSSDSCHGPSMESSDVRRGVSATKPRVSRSTTGPVATCIGDAKTSSSSYSRTGLTSSNSTFKATAIPVPSQRSAAGVRASRLTAPVATASKVHNPASSSSARGVMSARQSAAPRHASDAEDQARSRVQARSAAGRQTQVNHGVLTDVTPAAGRPSPAVSERTSSLTSQSTSSSVTAGRHSSTTTDHDTAAVSTSKPQKVNSDTQTTASAVQSAHIRRQLSEMAARSQDSASSRSSKVKRRDESSGSLNSDSTTASEEAGGGKSSSNSNNSASSVDSVVCRPTSSCDDELDTTTSASQRRTTTTDHIASLRSKKHNDKLTTTTTSVKPMPPIVRSAYLRATGAADVTTTSPRSRDLGSAASRLGVDQRGPGYRQWTRDTALHDAMTGAPGGGGGGGGCGYMSDGDIVRSACRVPAAGDDVNCGYMSEGGVSLYMKRMQQRFREGMLAVRESLEKNNGPCTDDDRSLLVLSFIIKTLNCYWLKGGHVIGNRNSHWQSLGAIRSTSPSVHVRY